MSSFKVISTILILIAALFTLFALPVHLTQLSQKAGVVQSHPTDVAGVWRIDNQTFYATTLTEVTQLGGEVTGGVCVQVQYIENGQTLLINKVQRTAPSVCGGDTAALEQATVIR